MIFRRFFATVLVCLSFAIHSSAAPAPTVHIGQNFTGTSYGSTTTNSGALPADGNGAIGPNHFVEFVNGAFAVYNKTNGERVEFKTDVDFWAGAGVALDVFAEVSDPRVLFDPVSQRWFASQIDIDVLTQIIDDMLGTNNFLLAVSVTSDPTGQWKGVKFPTDPNGDNFGDFPTLGVDALGVYLAADMYDATTSPSDPTASDVGQTLVSIPKVDMLRTTPTVANRTWHGIIPNSVRGQVYQPTTCSDGSSVGIVLSTGDIGSTSAPYSNLVSFAVQNVTNAGTATLGPARFITVTPYVVPDNVAAGVPLLTATQPDGTSTLQANDARFSAKVYSVAGVLYGVQSTELNQHIAIRWYRIHASDGALLESGTIADPNLDYFYPSIAANTNGTVVIGFNASGLSTYISSFAVAGQTTNGVTTFGEPLLLQSGLENYHGDDETGGGLGTPAPTSRWGDYSATSVDPADPNRFWTIQMYPSDTNVWSTAITELITFLKPELRIAAAGTNVTISWPTGWTGYQLQSATNLTAASTFWSNVSQSPLTNGTRLFVQVPATGKRQFFRLKQ
jgi:hypothetical protein